MVSDGKNNCNKVKYVSKGHVIPGYFQNRNRKMNERLFLDTLTSLVQENVTIVKNME